jgi:hypothetical protein
MPTLSVPSLSAMGMTGSAAIQPGFSNPNGLARIPETIEGPNEYYDSGTPVVSLKGAGNVNHMNTTMTYNFHVALTGANVGHKFIMKHDLVLGRPHKVEYSAFDNWELRSLPYMNFLLRYSDELAVNMRDKTAQQVLEMWKIAGATITTGRQPGDGVSTVTLETRGSTRVNNLWTLVTRADSEFYNYMPQPGWHMFLYLRRLYIETPPENKKGTKKRARERMAQEEEEEAASKRRNERVDGTWARMPSSSSTAGRRQDQAAVAAKAQPVKKDEWHWVFEPRMHWSSNPPFPWSDHDALVYVGMIEDEQRSGGFLADAVQQLVSPPANFMDVFNPSAQNRLSQFLIQLDPRVMERPSYCNTSKRPQLGYPNSHPAQSPASTAT